jgi:formamidopyrimidine-DNA glycosylase
MAEMPEMPELQAHAERLDRDFAGAHLERFDLIVPFALETVDPAPDAALQHPIAFVGRRGKYLVVDFGVVTFVVGLAQGGRLGVERDGAGRTAADLARWGFADGRSWLLTENGSERRPRVWVVAGNPEQQVPLSELGPDANDVSPGKLMALFHADPMTLHGFLQDQRVVAGLGPRLANEVCHRAKLSPLVSTLELTTDDAERVVEAIHACANEYLAYERGQEALGRSDAPPGNVDHRGGKRCPVCGDVVRSVGYGTSLLFYCPSCQTGGRILGEVAGHSVE